MTERRIHTRIVFQWNEHKKQYDLVDNIHYLYDGPIALAAGQPTREWTDWAFYNDGTESGSVIIGTKNTNPTLDVDTIYFFRVGLHETANNKWNNAKARLEYNHEGGGWTEVTTTSSVVRAVDSSNVADDDNTTQRMTSYNYMPTNAGVSETGVHDEGVDPQNSGFEALYVITIRSADVSDEDSIELRVWDYINGAFEAVNQTNPTITVNEVVAGVTLLDFERATGRGASRGTMRGVG